MIEKSKPFKVGDKVFGKVKGYPAWPAKITEVNGKRYGVTFYGTNDTGTLKHESIVYYLKNKEKFSNLQKRKYFPEAIIDIEEDIKNCGGSDGSPSVESPTKSESMPKTNNKRKRRIANVPQIQGYSPLLQENVTSENGLKLSKRLKIEDQNHNEPIAEDELNSQDEITSCSSAATTESPSCTTTSNTSQCKTENTTESGTTIETTKTSETTEITTESPEKVIIKEENAEIEVEEDESTSESFTDDTHQAGNQQRRPSTITEATENDDDDDDTIKSTNIHVVKCEKVPTEELEEPKINANDSIEDTAIKEEPIVVSKLNTQVLDETDDQMNTTTTPIIKHETDTSRSNKVVSDCVPRLEVLDLKDVHLYPDIFLTSIIVYAEHMKGDTNYYKNLPADPVSLNGASDTRMKVLPVKIDKDKYAGLVYVEVDVKYYSCEYDRAMADAKTVDELLELKTQLINGKLDVNDDRVIRNLGCDETYVNNTTNLSIVSIKKSKLHWLQKELDVFKHIVKIKRSLGRNGVNTKEALEHMTDILNTEIEIVSLKKRPSIIETISRLCRYVGRPKEWNLSEKEIIEFENNALMIREIGEAIFKKIRNLFEYGESDDFVGRFEKDCAEFSKFTTKMTEAEIFSLCAEPRSRRAQLELIFDEHANYVVNH